MSLPTRSLVATLLIASLGSVLVAQAPVPVVDVNGPYIILNAGAVRAWSHVTVELNGYWAFTTGVLPNARSLCLRADAFVVRPSLRGGRDFAGVFYDPATMQVKTALLKDARAATTLKVTKGLLKPPPDQEAAQCLAKSQ